jgi:hypothetical protein
MTTGGHQARTNPMRPIVDSRHRSAAGLTSMLWTAECRPHECGGVSGDRVRRPRSPAPGAPARSCYGP